MSSLTGRTQNIVFETDRLRFATWATDDWLAFKEIATDPLVVKYITTGEPWPDERIHEFVARQCENWEKHQICLWRLLLKDNDTMIGICGLQRLPPGPDVEIGWWLAPSHWGKGLATEAARQALAYGFDVGNFERIVAIAQSANRDSLRVMERIGMRFEREALHKGIRVVLYAIGRDRFLALRSEGAERA